MVIDPGGAEAGVNDPTGITIVDTDTGGDMFVVLADEYSLTPMGLINKIKELKDQYNPDDIRVEKEKYSLTIADIMQHNFPLMNVSFVEHKGRPKEDRIWRLKQLFEAKRIYIGHNQEAFKSQLIEYPHVTHDDILDSLAYHIDIRRIPEPHHVHTLFNGKPFVPNIAADFEEEINRVIERAKSPDEGRENDHIY